MKVSKRIPHPCGFGTLASGRRIGFKRQHLWTAYFLPYCILTCRYEGSTQYYIIIPTEKKKKIKQSRSSK